MQPPIHQTVVIIHGLVGFVEQLDARAPDAPSLDTLRPASCPGCGHPAFVDGIWHIVGHGFYSRQVRGLKETTWIVIWVRRYRCRACGRTISLLSDWLHPWRWYAATVIVEALFRHLFLHEAAASVGHRFGRPAEAEGWRQLRRWCAHLLHSQSLWGWLGPRLGVAAATTDRHESCHRLHKLLAEGGLVATAIAPLESVASATRCTLAGLVHFRKNAGPCAHFPPGSCPPPVSQPAGPYLPTEKDPGIRPPP